VRAAIYCRVSSDKQEDNYSLPSQEEACRRYAGERGYVVAEVYHEVYTGAALWERPQLTALRERVRTGTVEVVIAYAVDRLSRNQAHLFILVDEWERHGATPAFVSEELDQSPIGKVLLSLKGFAAEVEREKIQERTMRGLNGRLGAGKLKPGQRPLYGYRWPVETVDGEGGPVATVVRDSYAIDPETAAIVRRIYHWYAEGVPLLAIAERLNAEHVPTSTGGDQWMRAVVQRLLRNPAYKGEAWMNRYQTTTARGRRKQTARPEAEWVRLPDGVIPPLVDIDTWDAAQARAERNAVESARHNSSPESYLLRGGYAVCGHCGRPAFAKMVRERNGQPLPKYIVSKSPEQHRDCPGFAISAAQLDAAASVYLRRVALNPEVLAWELSRLDGTSDATNADRKAVESRLAEVKRRQRILSASVETLDDPEAAAPLLERLKALAGEKRTLEQEREAMAARASDHAATIGRLRDLKDRAAEIAENFDLLSYELKRDLVAAVNLTVRLYPSTAPERYTFESDADGLLRAIGLPSRAR